MDEEEILMEAHVNGWLNIVRNAGYLKPDASRILSRFESKRGAVGWTRSLTPAEVLWLATVAAECQAIRLSERLRNAIGGI